MQVPYLSKQGNVKIGMVGFLKNTLGDFPEVIISTFPTLAYNHLFIVRDDANRMFLEEERAVIFHHAVTQLMFVTIKYRQDI